MVERIPVAFVAGLVSVAFPCVLPLVPGYLSAISAVEVERLGERGVAKRVALASVPFALGFTVVFVLLGAAAAALASVLDPDRQTEVAGFILVVLGLAFAVCAAPCVGAVLGSILVLAADSDTVLRGSVLLAAYSLGIAVAFVLAGIAFAQAMTAFRWVRDHYGWIRVASGLVLVALGLLLFFHRNWWLNVMLNRALQAIGLDQL